MRVALWCPPDDAEAAAAAVWCRDRAIELEPIEIPWRVAPTTVCWVHAGSRVPSLPSALRDGLANHLQQGGVVVLSLLATPIAQALGAPGPSPECWGPLTWHHADDPRWPDAFGDWPGYPHIRGMQAYGSHPLVEGLAQGSFTWMARDGDVVAGTRFVRPGWPAAGVIAVDRSYVHLDADEAVAWEYEVATGAIRCVGSHLCLTSGDALLNAQRDVVLRNLLTADWGARVRRWWPAASGHHASVVPVPAPRPLPPLDREVVVSPRSRTDATTPSPWTLGSAHGLATGDAVRGPRDLWLHPLCIVDDGFVLATSAGELTTVATEVSGIQVQRRLVDAAGIRWRETMFGAVDGPTWYFEVGPETTSPDAVAVEFRVPLRLAWPMPEGVLRPLRIESRVQGAVGSILVSGSDGQHRVNITVDGVDLLEVVGDDAAPLVRVIARPGTALRMAIRATAGDGFSPLAPPSDALAGAVARVASVSARSVVWNHPDAAFEGAMAWARTRLANFLTHTLSGRRGLAAGYATSRPGWNRSRPGYAWFFGRDACWTVDALLALGMFEEARAAITLLAATADVTGKVAHEISMSGVVHYDAADATPLFVRAVGRYARYSGDVDTVRAWWPAVRRALAFVRSCDRDNDGLPENDGVGHGWIEMGPLGGGSVTSYVAACWIDALRETHPVMASLEPGTDTALAEWERAAVSSLDRLRLPDGRMALHRDAGGRLESELTALAAVPIALDVDRSSSRHEVLRALAHPRFQAPWGLRMLPVDSARYAPRSYHAGAVWPLFTGWAALADAVVGDLEGALNRLDTIAGLVERRNIGAFDEVLDGDDGSGAGVCSDQAWSAAALVSPMMQGVLGLAPHAWGARGAGCDVHARVPARLHGLSLSAIRTGTTRWSARWSAEGVVVEHLSGAPLAIRATDVGRAVVIGEAADARRHLIPAGDR